MPGEIKLAYISRNDKYLEVMFMYNELQAFHIYLSNILQGCYKLTSEPIQLFS